MTARISLNLGKTGGHRPPLQSEHFLPLGKASREGNQFIHTFFSRGYVLTPLRGWVRSFRTPPDPQLSSHPEFLELRSSESSGLQFFADEFGAKVWRRDCLFYSGVVCASRVTRSREPETTHLRKKDDRANTYLAVGFH